ncbi:MAG: signal recognition particle-docking protein FtsY [Candidatus Marinimicrobia bacterium]|nr:signal recognition particle-docking protein FtsY [Candidatus Neomarinimicrobiota bacterium]MBL7022670.1 signal recognition particle-docking protein FtsY [Candidatus Neomarinimicrobiota bacterium]MBL7109936.1 signal recognition particle-docking protein FtsY [Candidatus Neomarinimicrobiota bacterium]
MFKFFKKTYSGLKKTRTKIANMFTGISGKKHLSADDLEKLEEALLQADLGWEVVDNIVDSLSKSDDKNLAWEERFLNSMDLLLNGKIQTKPLRKTILLVGINGTGKTTSAAKLAGEFSKDGESVLLVAGDTYRAAAVEQIREWSKRLKVQLVANEGTSDPAAVAFDGVNSGLSKNVDRIIVDTAGRLHTSLNLMKELEKINRVVRKMTDEVDVLITIDANTGQNGIQQAREFNKYLPIDGVILTKMDGTARGGIAVPIMLELNLPVYYIGVGEQVDDLVPFDMDSYLKGLIGIENE